MAHDIDPSTDRMSDALRRMPVAPPRAGFFDRAFATATSQSQRGAGAPHALRRLITAWEAWVGAAVGATAAAAFALLLLRPSEPTALPPVRMTLSVNETRSIDVMIASERELPEATIRIFVSGGIELDGFEHDREIDWRTRLERGSNLLSVPVVARSAGPGRLIAIVEHDGRTRRVAIDLAVVEPELRS